MKRAPTTMLAAAVLFGASPAAAEDCPQERAIYADDDGSLTLEFSPNDGGPMMASNVFTVAMANDIVIDGVVIWNVGLPRPNGIMMHACPDGDATGEEIEACTVWEGVVYSVDGSGRVDYLAPEDKPAAEQLLFPDLGRSVRYSAVWGEGKVGIVPRDVLKLSGCRE